MTTSRFNLPSLTSYFIWYQLFGFGVFINIGQVVAADESSQLGKDFFLYSTNINLKNRNVAFADERQRYFYPETSSIVPTALRFQFA